MLARKYPGGEKALTELVESLEEMLTPCTLCPRECGVDRLAGEIGFCGVGRKAKIASAGPHFGEEPPLVGHGGSGTIFLSGCNLGCVYCQNADISHGRSGRSVSTEDLAKTMLSLQSRGCHNINFVTPTHQTPAIVKAIVLAMKEGLNLPIVYNCGGYEKLEVIQKLHSIVDIYMPDLKYATDALGEKYSVAPDYWSHSCTAIEEMFNQVGDLTFDFAGVATTGLLVRHLVLPHNLAGTKEALEFLASLSTETYVNIMGQYRPCYEASRYKELSRRPTREEMSEAFSLARKLKLTRALAES